MSYYYISNPYNGSASQMDERARVAAHACGTLLRRGIHAWSPIVHNHALVRDFSFTLEERRSLMLPFDFTLLRKARGMIVLTIDGWKESYGVGAEIELCSRENIPVVYVNPDELDKLGAEIALP